MRLAGTTEPTTPSMQPRARFSGPVRDHRRGRNRAMMSSRFVSWAHAIACPWILCFNEKGMLRAVGPPQELHVCPSPSKHGGEPRSALHRWKNSNKGPPLMETKRSAPTGAQCGGLVRGDESCGRTYTRGAWYPYIERVHLQALPRSVIPHPWMKDASGTWSRPPANGIRDGPGCAAADINERLSTSSASDLLIRYQTTSRSPYLVHHEVFPAVGVRRCCRGRRSEAR